MRGPTKYLISYIFQFSQIVICSDIGGTENDGHENDGSNDRHEIAAHETRSEAANF